MRFDSRRPLRAPRGAATTSTKSDAPAEPRVVALRAKHALAREARLFRNAVRRDVLHVGAKLDARELGHGAERPARCGTRCRRRDAAAARLRGDPVADLGAAVVEFGEEAHADARRRRPRSRRRGSRTSRSTRCAIPRPSSRTSRTRPTAHTGAARGRGYAAISGSLMRRTSASASPALHGRSEDGPIDDGCRCQMRHEQRPLTTIGRDGCHG